MMCYYLNVQFEGQRFKIPVDFRHRKKRGLYFFYVKGKEQHQFRTGFSVHHRIIPSVKRIEFVSNKMSNILVVLRGRWCNITVLNIYALSKDESDDSEDSFMRN